MLMKRKNFLTVALCSSVLAGTDSSHAQAIVQKPVRGELEVGNIYDVRRPDYYPDGIRAGSFVLRPMIVAQATYDDNIFADETNEQSDTIFSVRPIFLAESDWNNHRVFARVEGNFVRYAENSDEDYDDFLARIGGRLDVMRDVYVFGDASHAIRHEERSSPDDVDGVEPTEFIDDVANLGITRDVGKISVTLRGRARKLDFDNVRASGGGIINNSARDRKEYRAGGRIGYEFIPNYEAFADLYYNWRRYDNLGTVNRDSEGYSAVLGTAMHLSGKLRGEVFAGYRSQDYEAAALADIDSVVVGGSVLWSISPITSLEVGVEQSVREAVNSSFSGYLSTEADVRLEHELQRNLLVGAEVGFTRNDFESNTATQREDDTIRAGVDTRYLIRRGIDATAAYEFTDRDSNITGGDFTNNKVMLRLNFAI